MADAKREVKEDVLRVCAAGAILTAGVVGAGVVAVLNPVVAAGTAAAAAAGCASVAAVPAAVTAAAAPAVAVGTTVLKHILK